MIKIIVADRYPLITAGLKYVLSDEPDLQIVAELDSGYEVITTCLKHEPQILVLDLLMSGPTPYSIIQTLNVGFPNLSIVVLASGTEMITAQNVLALGVRGYLRKQDSLTNIVQAIRVVLQGGVWPEKPKDPESLADGSDEMLSDREIEVLQMMGGGLDNIEIAEQMSISERTVRFHIENILKKLQVHNRVTAITKAIQKGWILLERQ